MSNVDWGVLQRVTRATCTELHRRHLAGGLIVRPKRDPGQYRFNHVFPVLLAAFDAGLIREVE